MGNRKPKLIICRICSVTAYYIAGSYLDMSTKSLANYNANTYMRMHINVIDVIAITQLDENSYILELDSPYIIIHVRIELAIKYIIVSNKDARKIKERLEQYYDEIKEEEYEK